MECMNSEVNPFSTMLQSMNSNVHDLFIYKILDYITIFKTMKQDVRDELRENGCWNA